MNLGELIAYLERWEPSTIFQRGLEQPHSYRGYYEQLAWKERGPRSVADMLIDARGAVGAIMCGYKGGDYKMDPWTDCWIANYGSTGAPLTEHFFTAQIAEQAASECQKEIDRLKAELQAMTLERDTWRSQCRAGHFQDNRPAFPVKIAGPAGHADPQ